MQTFILKKTKKTVGDAGEVFEQNGFERKHLTVEEDGILEKAKIFSSSVYYQKGNQKAVFFQWLDHDKPKEKKYLSIKAIDVSHLI